MKIHKFPLRIYYEDTDAGGIVYHSNFLNFTERARTEMLRDLGYSNVTLEAEEKILFIVRRATCDYQNPGFLEDQLEVHTSVKQIKNSSFVLRQSVIRPEKKQENDTMLCDVEVVLVCVAKDKNGIKPTRMPDKIRTAFEDYLTPA